jgi:5,10-methylenetetrahydrofolate reductase
VFIKGGPLLRQLVDYWRLRKFIIAYIISLNTFYQLRVVSSNCGMPLDSEFQKFMLYWAKLEWPVRPIKSSLAVTLRGFY